MCLYSTCQKDESLFKELLYGTLKRLTDRRTACKVSHRLKLRRWFQDSFRYDTSCSSHIFIHVDNKSFRVNRHAWPFIAPQFLPCMLIVPANDNHLILLCFVITAKKQCQLCHPSRHHRQQQEQLDAHLNPVFWYCALFL